MGAQSTLVALAALAASSSTNLAQGFPVLVEEDFDNIPASEDPDWCWKSSLCDYLEVADQSFADTKVLDITYEPNYQGSPRVQQKAEISPGLMRAAVTYNMYFQDGFEWVKGGKLGIGLFGGTATTGCKAVDAEGFSARTMWRRDGELVMYLYDQKRTDRCGRDVNTEVNGSPVYLQTGRWYRMTLYVELNEPASESNGMAALFLDGAEVARMEGMQWRGDGADTTLIDNWGLSTFYGGSDSSWAPSENMHIYLDNVTLAGSVEKTRSCDVWCRQIDFSNHCSNPLHPCSGCEACDTTAPTTETTTVTTTKTTTTVTTTTVKTTTTVAVATTAAAGATTSAAAAATTSSSSSSSSSSLFLAATTTTTTTPAAAAGTTTADAAATTTSTQTVGSTCKQSCIDNAAIKGWDYICGWSSCEECTVCGEENPECKFTCTMNFESKGEETVCGWSSCRGCKRCL